MLQSWRLERAFRLEAENGSSLEWNSLDGAVRMKRDLPIPLSCPAPNGKIQLAALTPGTFQNEVPRDH
jgi:hypothetical protein